MKHPKPTFRIDDLVKDHNGRIGRVSQIFVSFGFVLDDDKPEDVFYQPDELKRLTKRDLKRLARKAL